MQLARSETEISLLCCRDTSDVSMHAVLGLPLRGWIH